LEYPKKKQKFMHALEKKHASNKKSEVVNKSTTPLLYSKKVRYHLQTLRCIDGLGHELVKEI